MLLRTVSIIGLLFFSTLAYAQDPAVNPTVDPAAEPTNTEAPTAGENGDTTPAELQQQHPSEATPSPASAEGTPENTAETANAMMEKHAGGSVEGEGSTELRKRQHKNPSSKNPFSKNLCRKSLSQKTVVTVVTPVNSQLKKCGINPVDLFVPFLELFVHDGSRNGCWIGTTHHIE